MTSTSGRLLKSMDVRLWYPICGLLTLWPQVSGGMALFLGVLFGLMVGNPYVHATRQWTHRLLAISVVGLGAGMDLGVIGRIGLEGVGYTLVGISLTLILGIALTRWLRVLGHAGALITVGTAICGGSAIAAVAPVLKAKHHEVTVALATVFLLNAVALFIFPPIGHIFNLNQHQFGLWSALAIHDTSSVVGATMQFGPESVEIGTTVKLARALWIVPLVLALGAWQTRSESQQGVEPTQDRAKTKYPVFILGFIAAAALVTYVPALQPVGHWVEVAARRVLVLTLFLIGSNLSRETMRHVGLRPLVLGLVLWLSAASATLAAILGGLI